VGIQAASMKHLYSYMEYTLSDQYCLLLTATISMLAYTGYSADAVFTLYEPTRSDKRHWSDKITSLQEDTDVGS